MLRRESEVAAEFAKDYDGPQVDIDGFKYVPWPQVVRILDRVVGAGNWNDRVIFHEYNYERGWYTHGVELSITVASDEDGSPKTITHYGVSTSVAQPSKRDRENGLTVASSPKTHETAIDGSASLARTKASKSFGNLLGLKLYKNAEEFVQADEDGSAPPPRRNASRPASTGNGGGNGGGGWSDRPALEDVKEDSSDKDHKGLTKAQLNYAKKKGDLTDDDLANMTRGEVKAVLEGSGTTKSRQNASTAARTGTPSDYEDNVPF